MRETLGVAIPDKEPWEKRRQAVLVYKVARKFLTKKDWHKAEPSEEDIVRFIQDASETPHLMAILRARAEAQSKKEFWKEAGVSEESQIAIPIEDFRKADQVLKEKYMLIDQDPTQNRAFLDPILFPDG